MLIDDLKSIIKMINDVILKEGDPWGFNNNLLVVLVEMEKYINENITDCEKRGELCDAAGRILMDNPPFADGEIGGKIFEFMERFQS